MTSTKDIEYIETREIKRGNAEMPEEFLRLKKAFLDKFGIAPINFFFEVLPHNNKPRLQPIFDKTEELHNLTDKYGYHELNREMIEIFQSVYGINCKYPTDNLFVICSAFDKLSVFEAHLNISDEELEQAVSPLVKNFWCVQKAHIVMIVVFSLYDSDLEFNQSMMKNVQNAYFDLLSKNDEFNYFNSVESIRIIFDSKENFDQNYGSNWRNYFDR